MRRLFHKRWVVLAVWLGCVCAYAEYPDKPIRMIVPQAPGSATDTAARILASELTVQLGQTIVVENRPGGGFTIGLDLVAKAPLARVSQHSHHC